MSMRNSPKRWRPLVRRSSVRKDLGGIYRFSQRYLDRERRAKVRIVLRTQFPVVRLHDERETAKPMPILFPFVVTKASKFLSGSSIPGPLSITWIATSLSSQDATLIVTAGSRGLFSMASIALEIKLIKTS